MTKPLYQKATQEELDRRKAFYSDINIQLRASTGLSNADQWNSIFPEFGLNNINTNINVLTAQRLSVVYTCLNVLGETRGSLPCEVIKKTDKGNITMTDDPIYRLIHDRPNPYTTAFDFWSTIEKHKKAWGNAFVEIERWSSGFPKALWIRHPQFMTHSATTTGDVYYLFEGREIRYTDMLHFKNYSYDGFTGISTIRQNALSIGTGLKLKEYNSKLIGDRPWGFLTTETRPKDLTAKSNIQGMWVKKSDNSTQNSVLNQTNVQPERVNVGSTMNIPLLYGGVKFESLALPADDVAYIATSQMTNVDIYGIFRVPPTFGQDWEHTPYKGAEQQDLIFAKYTLASIRGDEQECTEKLFPESNKNAKEKLYIKFNLKGLLAGDHASRQAFYTALFNIGAMNANEIRECEDQPHYEGGDQYFVQGALVPIDLIGDLIKAKITQAKNKGLNANTVANDVKRELRTKLKEKLNGHYKDIQEIVE